MIRLTKVQGPTLITRVALVLGVLFLAGCSSWRPATLTQSPSPRTVKVTLRDQSVVWLKDARMQDDSLLVGQGPSSEHVAIHLRDLSAVQADRFDPAKTLTLLGLGLPTLLVTLLWLTYCDTCT